MGRASEPDLKQTQSSHTGLTEVGTGLTEFEGFTLKTP